LTVFILFLLVFSYYVVLVVFGPILSSLSLAVSLIIIIIQLSFGT